MLQLALALVPLAPGDLDAGPVETDTDSRVVRFDLSWRNGWRNERNHDAAWIVLRDADGPLRLATTGHGASGDVAGRVVVSGDGVGAFVEPTEEHRGDVRWVVELTLEARDADADVEVWAVEMVYVPGGPFELGDDEPRVAAKGSFRRVEADGSLGGPLRVESEAPLPVGAGEGSLGYNPGNTPQYVGDGRGPIPAAFPKGTRAFYVMKYELRQGQYARFLDALDPAARASHAPLELGDDEPETCSIALVDGHFEASAPDRPCNFVTWADTSAWLDWTGLRPMTELEFEKAARGPSRPEPGDFPWGTAVLDGVERIVRPSRDLAAATTEDEAALTHATRARLAASHWWVMDLSGSVWERVVSAGHPRGRAFRGTHGDGVLANGLATNDDWPVQDAGGRAAPGIGYRGGAEYFGGEPTETNPFSCVGTRTYAAWDGAYRYKTYSARGVRTAP